MEDCIDIKNDRDKEMQGLKMWRDLSYSSVDRELWNIKAAAFRQKPRHDPRLTFK